MEFVKFWDQGDTPVSLEALNVILIAHVREPRGYMNNDQLQCSETERFSVEEFNEIYQGIVSAGFFLQAIFFNELDFINAYIEHPNYFKKCLVYTLARNGYRDNKKTIIPSFCELVGIRYSSSPSLSCALARNKYYFSTLLQRHSIPVPRSWLLDENGTWINGLPENGTKLICKPSSESASQGISETKIINFSTAQKNLKSYNNHIFQEYIDGFECEVPILKVKNDVYVLPPIGIDLQGKHILDETASEHNHYGFYRLDKYFSIEVVNVIQEYAEKAFRLLQMDVYGRVDFRITHNGQPFIIDISTTPYTTKHSSFAYAFKSLGLEYCDVYRAIISAALMRECNYLKR